MNRRTCIATVASLGTIGFAGCLDESESSGGGDANGGSGGTSTVGEDNTQQESTIGGDGTQEDTVADTQEDTAGDSGSVVLTEHEWTVVEEYEHIEDTYGVKGRGENRTDETRMVFISIVFYDEEDVQISDTGTSVSGVKPGGVFEFEAMFLGDDPDRVDHYEYTVEAYVDE